ncbi:MAG: PC4/YdbC family ssDNA-binding protein [Peptoniphilus sp.]|uniref:YdbC family protein n=1 Tax=Peptoniphilus sp. TaxID=1971214 RepID=UPI002A766600|nr:PC4/YdbC family ssDNA-binding protein [Peptoniphilus sp.]MDY2987558.1 PC4/YdbC family ssDNA-binding protein [Peptoniphilus sp.]
MAEFKFEITRHVVTLSTKSNGWTKELNMVSWNGRAPKYDIREWDPEHIKMSKGITFDEAEFNELVEAIKNI